ncbi:hypothetical protein XCR1_1180002 [Xenorhabdus cabanillasii JM26]|uniref:Uncharacterized protein n=1 Tax=Xenorhabdus cabanillasii JM26 TaxID=1427517 RepID=W1IPM5_9GAMM|nr:transcriptional regulator [Xenorhabdus cabanillasii JM26]CDL79571.1 hypothetical protein XCR1_1180002 [Xenorhabdus cabanillasii JM26]
MNIKPIRTEQDYQGALKAIAPLFDNQPEMGIRLHGSHGVIN